MRSDDARIPSFRIAATLLERRILMSASPLAIGLPELSGGGVPTDPVSEPVSDAFGPFDLPYISQGNFEVPSPFEAFSPFPVLLQPGDANEFGQRTIELVFIDGSVVDRASLIADIMGHDTVDRDIHVIVLDSTRDGVQQVSEALSEFQNVDALHFVSHASDGSVQLGGTWLGSQNLSAYATEISQWSLSLRTGADLLIYGCDLAASADGRSFLESLGGLAQIDIAASSNSTGHEIFGGDWVLEYSLGTIDTHVAFSADIQHDWIGKLATINVSTFLDVVDGNTSSVAALLANRGADGFISLREAILAVNAGAGGDTILLGTGTYTLSIAGSNENAGATGDLDITRNMAIFGTNPGATIINAGGIDRVFHVNAGTVSISDLTIQGGNSAAASQDGGGLKVDSPASVSITNVVISGNSAKTGGAIYNDGTLFINSAVMDGNTADNGGGAIFNRGSLTLGSVTISNNSVSSGSGGAIDMNQGSLSATNVTFSGNSASGSGGAITTNRPVTLLNVTITNNSAGTGSGVHVFGGGSVDLRNTIIAGNNGSPDATGSFNSLGNNLIGNGGLALGFLNGVNGDQVGTILSPLDPMLGPLQFNGGLGHTHELLPGSPAINQGSLTGAPSNDQRGVARDSSPDIGAYEVSAAVNAPPTDITPNSFSIDENTNTAGGVSLGILTATDPDTGETFVFSIRPGGDAGAFLIGGAGANELVLTDGVLDFESKPSYSVTVRVTDSIGNIYDETLVVNVNDMNDSPINVVPGGQITGKNTPLVFSSGNGNQISVTDIDAGSGQVEVTLTATSGSVTLGWPSGTAVAAGGEFRVNTSTSDRQVTLDSFFGGTTGEFGAPRTVASDPNGNFVVTWSSKDQDGNGWGVYAQRYTAAGVAQGSEFRVNTTTNRDQAYSSVAMDDAGNFVVVWSSYEQDGDKSGVFARLYNAAGVAQSAEFQVNSYTNDEQIAANVAMDSTGNFVVTWTSMNQDDNDRGIYAKRFNAAGTALGGEFRVNNTSVNEQIDSSVAMDASGNFVIAWTSYDQDGDNEGVFAKRYDSAGIAQGTEFLVNSTTANEQKYSSVSMDATGNFVITWSSMEQDGDNWGVYAKRYNSAGVVQGSEFLVNVTTSEEQYYSSVSMDSDGDFVITWTSQNQDGSGHAIYARQYTSAGVAKAGETLVNTTTSGNQEFSSVAADAKGNFVVVWSGNGLGDSEGVFAQRYTIPTGLTFTAGDGTRDSNMTFRGTLAEVNAVLDGLVFTPAAGFNGLATLSIVTDDLGNTGPGGSQSDSDVILINVGNGNLDPTLTLSGAVLNYTENDPAIVIDSAVLISDPDSADFNGGQLIVYISGNGADSDILAIRNEGNGVGQIGVSGSNITYNFGAGAIVIGSFVGGTDGITPLEITFNANGNATAAQALARNITFVNTSDDPGILTRTVEFLLTDGDAGASILASTLVNVTETNDPPTISAQSFSINENSPNGTVVGTVVAADVDSGANGVLSYSIVGGTGSTAFAIDNSTGQITVADSSQLNFETADSFTLTVQVLDGGTPGLSAAATITINLLDVNESPTDISPQNINLINGTDTSGGFQLVSLTTTDPDFGETFAYTILPGADAGKFTIGGPGADRLILDDGVLNSLAKSVYIVNIRVTDSGGNTHDEIITLNVTGTNLPPTNINPGAFAVNENVNTTGGLNLGKLTAVDPDGGETFTWSILPGLDATVFSIGGSSLDELVLDNGVLDFETRPSYSVTIRVTDSVGNTFDKTIVVQVNDLNEAPQVSLNNVLASLAENASTASSIRVADIVITDDALGSNSLSLSGADAGKFMIVGGNQLHLRPGTVLDFETRPVLNVTVSVDDPAVGSSPDHSVAFSIAISDVNESPVANTDTFSVNTGTLFVSAPGVLVNDFNPEGNPLVPSLRTLPANGTLAFGPDGSFTYIPNAGFVGTDFFVYQIDDGVSAPATATVFLDVLLPGVSPPTKTGGNSGNPANKDDIATDPALEGAGNIDVANRAKAFADIAPTDAKGLVSDDANGISLDVNPNAQSAGTHKTSFAKTTTAQIANSFGQLSRITTSPTTLASTSAYVITNRFLEMLNDLRDEADSGYLFNKAVIGSTMFTTSALSIGYVIWLVRGGVLLSSVLSSLPAWRMVDPLPVLGFVDVEDESGEDDSLQSLVANSNSGNLETVQP